MADDAVMSEPVSDFPCFQGVNREIASRPPPIARNVPGKTYTIQ